MVIYDSKLTMVWIIYDTLLITSKIMYDILYVYQGAILRSYYDPSGC